MKNMTKRAKRISESLEEAGFEKMNSNTVSRVVSLKLELEPEVIVG